ncbi:18.1 kDa class I heat shock protein (Fragment) [Linum grandiflorum]
MPEAHVFKADRPRLKTEEVKVEVEEERILQISGDKWHCVERSSNKFVRRFRLPKNANVDQVKAAMENGVLTVMVPVVNVSVRRARRGVCSSRR